MSNPTDILGLDRTVSHLSHGHGNPKAKPVYVHDGMTGKQKNSMHLGGIGEPTADGGQPSSHPLSKPGSVKQTQMAPAHPSHRSRVLDAAAGGAPGHDLQRAPRNVDHELGRKILDQAYDAGSHNDRMARHVPKC